MSNDWKYATLGQRDRLKRIRGGDEDVYRNEKKLNASLRKSRQDSGLSTNEVDEWDKIVDNAYATYTKNTGNGLPKFKSDALSKIENEFNSYMKKLRDDTKEQMNDASEEARKNSEYIAETLANNGYSKNGSKYVREQDEISEELESLLEEILYQYNQKSKSKREELSKIAGSLRG